MLKVFLFTINVWKTSKKNILFVLEIFIHVLTILLFYCDHLPSNGRSLDKIPSLRLILIVKLILLQGLDLVICLLLVTHFHLLLNLFSILRERKRKSVRLWRLDSVKWSHLPDLNRVIMWNPKEESQCFVL